MSEENTDTDAAAQAKQDLEHIKLPPPPQRKETQVYYFILGKWTQYMEVEGSALVTAENPVPQQAQVLQRTVELNEAIDVHPIVYSLMARQVRPGYKITMAVAVNKELYEWYKEVERIIGLEYKKQREEKDADKTEAPAGGDKIITSS